MKLLSLFAALGLSLALIGCADSWSGAKTLPPDALPPVSGVSTVAAVPAPQPPAPRPPARQTLPDSSGWSNPEIPLSRHQTDIEACHGFAWARVDNDLRIDNDIHGNFDTIDSGLGFSALSRRVDLYAAKKQRNTLFERCMQSKGYGRG